MDWLQILTVILANFGIWLWARSEATADRRETQNILKEMKEEMKDFHLAMKDFHYRLLEIEKNRK
ncbi:MAG: hypothetical protein ACLFUW_00205 [Bacteroidales bacterium]